MNPHIPIQRPSHIVDHLLNSDSDISEDNRSNISNDYDSDDGKSADGYGDNSDNNDNNNGDENYDENHDENYDENHDENYENEDGSNNNAGDVNSDSISACGDNNDEPVKSSNDTWSHFLQQRFTLLENALIDSILGEKFDDVELCAYSRRSCIGTVHSPIFVSSRADFLAAVSPILRELVQSDSQNPRYIPVQYREHGYDDDSDLEDEDTAPLVDTPKQSSLEALDIASNDSSTDDDIVEEPTIKLRSNAVFAPHAAAKTWQALVGYLYTGRLVFTTLRSSRSPEYTPPECRIACSPKSMYRLATTLQIHVLKKRSENAIITDLSPENIVKEVFSDFSWRYPEILKVEVEYFRKHARNPSVKAELKKAVKIATSGKMKQGEVVLNALFNTLL